MANLPKAAELIGSTVTEQQFKTKLKQLVENIDRSYSTLAEANADIANIGVGAKVDTDDSGLHYKATAVATSLTKSPSDPLTQAKSYSEQQRKLGENQVFQGYFANPYYEVSANSLYFKPYAISLDRVLICFDRRYGYFAITLTDFNAQLAALFPADRINVTSPKGVTGCFQFKNEDTISINPISKLITNSITVASDKQDIPLIAWNYTDVRRCTEESKIRDSIVRAYAESYTDSKVLPLDTYTLVTAHYNSNGSHIASMPARLRENNSIVTYDTATDILYIPPAMKLFSGRSNSMWILSTAHALDLTAIKATTSEIKVWYNKTLKEFVAKSSITALTATEVLDHVLFCIVSVTNSLFEITSTFAYRVDFARNGTEISQERIKVVPSVQSNSLYIEYNSATSVLSIPAETIFRYKQRVISLPATTFSLKGLGTTALSVYWDLYTEQLVAKSWAANLNVKERFRFITVCEVRDRSITNTNKATSSVQITSDFPYKIDGFVFGIELNTNTVVKNTLDDSVKAIAHRGYSTDAPENTLPSYVLASQKGFSYVECDVNFTSDGVPVLLHDDTINRTSNGVGSINDLTTAQVKTYDFGAWKNTKYVGTTIPTLEEFLKLCFKLNLHPYMELKSFVGDTPAKTQIIIDMVERLGMKGRVSYIGSLQAMTIVKDLDSSARVGVVTSTSIGSWIPTLQGLRTGTNQVFADALIGTYTEAEIQSAAEAGISVEIWTTNTVSDVITAANLGISGITTDNLNIRQILNESYG